MDSLETLEQRTVTLNKLELAWPIMEALRNNKQIQKSDFDSTGKLVWRIVHGNEIDLNLIIKVPNRFRIYQPETKNN